MGYLISLGIYSFKGVKVGLDCANGSSWNIAKSVFDALGADTYVINAQPNGLNINNNAGSTHIEGLQKFVVEKGLDIGFAYDGDADRCLCVDEKELWIDRREGSKSLAWSSVLLAYHNIGKIGEVVDRPKALGDIRGVSYIYGMFYRFGLIDVPEKVKEKMKK